MEGIKKYYNECFPDRYPHKIGGFIKPVIDYLNMDYESFKHDIYTMTDTDLLTKLESIKYNDILNPYAIITTKALKREYIDHNFLNQDILKKVRRIMDNLKMIDIITEFESEITELESEITEFEFEITEFDSEITKPKSEITEPRSKKIEFNYKNFRGFMKYAYGNSMSEKMFIELCKIKNAMNIDGLIY